MDEKNGMSMFLVAIVAIVAIVGLIVLFLSMSRASAQPVMMPAQMAYSQQPSDIVYVDSGDGEMAGQAMHVFRRVSAPSTSVGVGGNLSSS